VHCDIKNVIIVLDHRKDDSQRFNLVKLAFCEKQLAIVENCWSFRRESSETTVEGGKNNGRNRKG
jgi:hypothetical protein